MKSQTLILSPPFMIMSTMTEPSIDADVLLLRKERSESAIAVFVSTTILLFYLSTNSWFLRLFLVLAIASSVVSLIDISSNTEGKDEDRGDIKAQGTWKYGLLHSINSEEEEVVTDIQAKGTSDLQAKVTSNWDNRRESREWYAMIDEGFVVIDDYEASPIKDMHQN